MKAKKNFENYYSEDVKNKIKLYSDTYFALLDKQKSQSIILVCIAICLVLIIYFLLRVYNTPIVFNVLYFLLLLIFIIITFRRYINVSKNQLYLDVNKMLYLDILSFLTQDKDIKFNPNSRVAKEYFKDSKLFNLDIYNYNGENFTTFNTNNERIIVSDIFIYNYKYKTLIDYFTENGKMYKRTTYRKTPNKKYQGLYIEIPLHTNLTSTVYLISNQLKTLIKDKINKVFIFSGKRVELENIDLEKEYNIYSDDETLARYIFDLSYMEQIMTMDNYIKNKKNIVYRTDNKLSVFIDSFTIDSIIKQKVIFNNHIIDEKYVKAIFNHLNSLIEIITTLQTNKK